MRDRRGTVRHPPPGRDSYLIQRWALTQANSPASFLLATAEHGERETL